MFSTEKSVCNGLPLNYDKVKSKTINLENSRKSATTNSKK
jgi:hypothetical protein